MIYTERQFLEIWEQVKNDLRKVLSLVRSLIYDRETGIRHINYIQDNLYERKIIPFKVYDEQDYYKIDALSDNDIISWLLEYFCLANTELKKLREDDIHSTPRVQSRT